MTFTPGTYRRPLVQAVHLGADSPWGAIADWCHGQLCGADGDLRTLYIVLPPDPVSSTTTILNKAYPGDWIVLDQGRYLVMCDSQFCRTFLAEDPVDTLNRIPAGSCKVPHQTNRR